MSEKFNPLEIPVDEGGNYLQRVPQYTFSAIRTVFHRMPFTGDVLFELVTRSALLTYMSEQIETLPVKISTTELAEDLHTHRQTVDNAIKQLKVDGWVTVKNGGRGKKAEYHINFEKVRQIVVEFYMKKQNRKFEKRMSEAYERDGQQLFNMAKHAM